MVCVPPIVRAVTGTVALPPKRTPFTLVCDGAWFNQAFRDTHTLYWSLEDSCAYHWKKASIADIIHLIFTHNCMVLGCLYDRCTTTRITAPCGKNPGICPTLTTQHSGPGDKV